MVGRFGSLKFRVSDEQALTFKDLKVSRSLNTTEHETPWYKGRLEVTGEKLDEATMTIWLRTDYGVNPRRQQERIRQMMHQKMIHYLVIGGRPIMDRRCLITSMSEGWKIIMHNGAVFEIGIDVTFKEYG